MKILSEYFIYWLGDLELRQFSFFKNEKKNRKHHFFKVPENDD